MFGYIQPLKAELKIKEFEMYKAVYCSLCKNLGKKYGFFARITLSYDFTFLSLLKLSLVDGCNQIDNKHCVYNPLKKCSFLKNYNDLDLPSAAAAILLYYKILDNIKDEKGFKKLAYKVLKICYKPSFKKAKSEYPKIDEIVSNYINKQSELEKLNCSNIDEISEPTAVCLGNILKLVDEKQQKILYHLGYALGKWIYLTDCLADIEQDYKKNRYNPLLFGGNTKEYGINRLKDVLDFCQIEVANAFELLTIFKYKDILGNIIYLGLDESRKKLQRSK